jgi:hypothetical protein
MSLYLWEETPLQILQVVAWAPVPFWAGVAKKKSLISPGVRIPTRQYMYFVHVRNHKIIWM